MGICAWAPDRLRAFAELARGVFALIVDPATVEVHEHREVRAQADSPEALVVNWINEGLYVQEIEGFAVHTVEVTVCTDRLVHGLLRGEPLDTERHGAGTIVKAATFHRVGLTESADRVELTLIVDV